MAKSREEAEAEVRALNQGLRKLKQAPVNCSKCFGTGKLLRWNRFNGQSNSDEACEICRGSGVNPTQRYV